jgi:hypothetical protein
LRLPVAKRIGTEGEESERTINIQASLVGVEPGEEDGKGRKGEEKKLVGAGLRHDRSMGVWRVNGLMEE